MIIALYGYSGAGKDTIAKEFIKDGFERIAFADEPKKILSDMIGIDFKNFDEIKDKEIEINFGFGEGTIKHKKTVREILILLAESVKSSDKNIWVKSAIKNIENNKNYIITDLRFFHEKNYLQDNFNEIKFVKILGGKQINEDEIPDEFFDLVIHNENKNVGEIEKFKNQIKELF